VKEQRVLHQGLGFGVIKRERWGGMQYLVEFDNGMRLWVNRTYLSFIEPIKREGIRARPVKGGDFAARKQIEAFRFGIVPHFAIHDFTFGRDEELREIEEEKRRFEMEGGGVLIIEGEYGSGKTHLLDYISVSFLKEGYGVARIELDPFDVSPCRPKHVYREIVHSLRYIKGEVEFGFRDLLHEMTNLRLDPPHLFYTKALDLLKKGVAPSMVFDWIEGEAMGREYLNFNRYWNLPVLLDHSPAVDIYCYLLSGISYMMRQIGLKGFVIIIDEGETLFHIWFREELGFFFYKGLMRLATNDEALVRCELEGEREKVLGVGMVDRSGLIHSAVRPMPYAYSIPTYIFLIMALTPSSSTYYDRVLDLGAHRMIRLSRLKREDIAHMFERLVKIYEDAFPPFRLQPKERDGIIRRLVLEDESVRHLLRRHVEEMDLLRHYGR
jgi:hypothetical protein